MTTVTNVNTIRRAFRNLWDSNRVCHECELRDRCAGAVPGDGYHRAAVMLVGEAPGRREDETGHPFQGPAGKYLNGLLKTNGMHRDDFWVTNVVKCRPSESNETPSAKYIATCSPLWLQREIELINPEIVVAMGATAIQYFLGKGTKVEDVHGLPFFGEETGHSFTVFATYHPAAVLNNPSTIGDCEEDFRVLSQFLAGEEVRAIDPFPDPHYEWTDDITTIMPMPTEGVVAVDFELEPDYLTMFCWSLSVEPGTAYAMPPTEANLMALKELCENPNVKKVFHNMIGVDYQVLQRYGIGVSNFGDTMVGAYVLSWTPQGLKPLSKRRLGMEMKEYGDLVWRARRPRAVEYLENVVWMSTIEPWPDPPPIVESKWDPKTKRIVEKTKRPQNIMTKAKSRITKAKKEADFDVWGSWYKLEEEERAVVEKSLGLMPDVGLADVAELYDAWPDVIHYAARDADATLRLWMAQEVQIRRNGLKQVLDIDLATLPLAAHMMANGMMIEPDELRGLAEEWVPVMDKLEMDAWWEAGTPFNLASPPQTAKVLYENLQLPIIKRGKLSTDAKTLTELKKRTGNPVLDHIMDWRHFAKLKGTYAETIPKLADVDNRVYTTIKVTRTSTGRWSSAEPINLMNLPARDAEGKRIRQAFRSRDGWILVAVDLSQVEMRMMAHLSHDAGLMEAFSKGIDVHAATAAEVAGCLIEQVTADMRRLAKIMNFGVIYGMTDEGFAVASGKTVFESAAYIKSYFRRHRGIEQWMEITKTRAMNYGFVEDLIGRRRYIPEVAHPYQYVVEEGLRQAINQPVQGGAQEIMKIAEAQLEPSMLDWGLADDFLPLIQVHDELIQEATEKHWEDVAYGVQYLLENAMKLDVPILAEIKVGHRWGNMEEQKGMHY